MEVTALIKGKKYIYQPPDKQPVVFVYGYPIFGLHLFDDLKFSSIHLLHDEQIKHDLKELET